jgi:hypothetical protein
MLHGIPRVHPPPAVPFINPFLIRVHCLSKHTMRMRLLYHFGFELMETVMNSNAPFVYPIVFYGDEWNVTIFILY